jgi:hypothetical protein
MMHCNDSEVMKFQRIQKDDYKNDKIKESTNKC